MRLGNLTSTYKQAAPVGGRSKDAAGQSNGARGGRPPLPGALSSDDRAEPPGLALTKSKSQWWGGALPPPAALPGTSEHAAVRFVLMLCWGQVADATGLCSRPHQN